MTFCTVRAIQINPNVLSLSEFPSFVLFFGVQRPLFSCMLDRLREGGTAQSLLFEVFIDEPAVYCFAGDSTLKSKFAN